MIVALLLAGTALAQDSLVGAGDFPLSVSIEGCPFQDSACFQAVDEAFASWSDECLPLEIVEAPTSEATLRVVIDATLPAGEVRLTGLELPVIEISGASLALESEIGADCTDAYSLSALAQAGLSSVLGVRGRAVGPCDTLYEPNVEERTELGEAFVSQADFTCVPNVGAEVLGAVPLEVTCTLESAQGLGSDEAQWRFGDGATAVGPVVAHTYTEPGNYAVGVSFGDDPDTCALAAVDRTKIGYVNVCARPDVAFELYHNGGLSYTMLNRTDVSVYGCIYDIEWTLYEGGSANGKPLEGPLKAWEPSFELPEEGRYTIKAEASGIAGKGAAVMSFQAKRGVGDGLQKVTCASSCSSSGGSAAAWPLLVVAGLLGVRRRRE